LIARTSAGPIGEAAAGFLDDENPRCVIPGMEAFGQDGIDFAANQLDKR